MTRVLIDDCHRRLQKYKVEIEENRRQCVHTLGDSIAADLGKTISALAHNRQAKKREVLERKLTKLKPPGTERSNLVHNLSSKQLTEQQLRVLQHEAYFNTADADPVDFIAALEAMLVRSETSDDMKHSVRQHVTSLLMTHRPTKCILQKQTGRMLGSRIHEHKLAVRRGDVLSQVAAHTYEMGHEFNFTATKIVAHAGNKTGRELIEAWASDENPVNRFIDLAPAYRALRSHLQSCAAGR
ncbi:hypothetical protein SprV_0902671300 [Sparganum proliferum]